MSRKAVTPFVKTGTAAAQRAVSQTVEIISPGLNFCDSKNAQLTAKEHTPGHSGRNKSARENPNALRLIFRVTHEITTAVKYLKDEIPLWNIKNPKAEPTQANIE